MGKCEYNRLSPFSDAVSAWIYRDLEMTCFMMFY